MKKIAAVLTLALSLSVLGGVTAPPPAAAVDEEVIAWVEVEDGVIGSGPQGAPVFNSGDHSNFSGTGSYTFRETGMSSTMTVNAPEAGVYPIYVRYAAGPLSPGENVTRSMGLLTNGGDRQQMSLPMTSFSDWETWGFVEYDVTLTQGANTVTIHCDRAVDFCRLNFDAIQVGGTAPDPCVATLPDPGYTSLFDGTFTSFDRWRKAGAGGFGRQTDCTIQTFRGPGAEWFTEQQTAPYTLKVDWRREGSNDDSSVYLVSSDRSATPVGGFAVRIGADTGAIVPTSGTAEPADAAAVASAQRPVGEWNTYAIRVTATQVSVYLNGRLVNTFTSPAPIPASGFVGLENRSSTDQVDFRSIQIKPGVEPDVASTTTLSVAPATVAVKRGTVSVGVTVSAAGETPTGDVELSVGGVPHSTVTLVDGRATASVGPFDSVGTKSVTARYLGSDTVRPSSSDVMTVAVSKAVPKVTVRTEPARVRATQTRAKLVIAVKALGFTPTGKVKVRIDKLTRKRTYAATLRGGKATITLARFTRPGRARATVSYLGDALARPASTAVTIRVLRATRR